MSQLSHSLTEAGAEKQRNDDKEIEENISQRETDEAVSNLLLTVNNNEPVDRVAVSDSAVGKSAGTSVTNPPNKVKRKNYKKIRDQPWIKKCRTEWVRKISCVSNVSRTKGVPNLVIMIQMTPATMVMRSLYNQRLPKSVELDMAIKKNSGALGVSERRNVTELINI